MSELKPCSFRLPKDLIEEVREIADQHRLANTDILRMSIMAGLPSVREGLRKITPEA